MNSKREKLMEGIRSLCLIAEDLYKNNQRRRKEAIDRLTELDIANLTINDMREFISRQSGKNCKFSVKEIFEYIMNDNNKEILISLGDMKNPIDTSRSDIIYLTEQLRNDGMTRGDIISELADKGYYDG